MLHFLPYRCVLLSLLSVFGLSAAMDTTDALAMAVTTGCSTTPITFTEFVDMDFDVIDGLGPGGSVDIGTNGNIDYGAGFSGDDNGAAGQVLINGTTNCSVLISCATTATMSDGGGNTFTMDSIETRLRDGRDFGGGAACLGIGVTSIRHRLRGNDNRNRLYIGGSLDTTAGLSTGGTYQLSNAGGTTIAIQVVYETP